MGESERVFHRTLCHTSVSIVYSKLHPMALVVKGYRVVPQSLADNHGRGFRHLHLKEHRGAFKTAARPKAGSKEGQEVVFSKGKTLFVGNIDDQGVFS